MSLEEKLAELTEAVVELTDAMKNNGAGGTTKAEEEEAPAKKAPAKKSPAKKAPAKKAAKESDGPTMEEVRDKLRQVSKEVSPKEARGILGEFDAKKVTDLDEKDYNEVMEMAEEALEGAESEDEEEDDDDDI